jgi:ankyrin repeat protein
LTKTLTIDTDHRVFYQLIRSINQSRYVTHEDGSSLLHLSVSDRTLSSNPYIDRFCKYVFIHQTCFLKDLMSSFRYPCLHTVRTLIQCGADVNACNTLRNTPIHIFVSNSSDGNEAILQLLCEAHAHLDYANVLREIPMDLALNLNIKRLLKTRMRLSLKCLCARLIQMNDIPFHGKIVNSLVTFVERH